MNGVKSRKVLVVDDESAIIELIRLILTEEGYDVHTAKDGREGIRLFNQIDPDIVLTDIVMPDMEGIEFIQTIAKMKKGLPIIAMSGNVMGKGFLKAAHLLGAMRVLHKPFTSAELIDAVGSVPTTKGDNVKY
jgi:CheY-like chemotaxis protein